MGVGEQSELQAGDVIKATLTLQPQRVQALQEQQAAQQAARQAAQQTATLPARGAAARSARHSKSLDQLRTLQGNPNHQVSYLEQIIK